MESNSTLNPRSQRGAIIQVIYDQGAPRILRENSKVDPPQPNQSQDSKGETPEPGPSEDGGGLFEIEDLPPEVALLLAKQEAELRAEHNAQMRELIERHESERHEDREYRAANETWKADVIAEIEALRGEVQEQGRGAAPAPLPPWRDHFTEQELDSIQSRWLGPYKPATVTSRLSTDVISRAFQVLRSEKNFPPREAKDFLMHVSPATTDALPGNTHCPLSFVSKKRGLSNEPEKELPTLYREYTLARIFLFAHKPADGLESAQNTHGHRDTFRRFIRRHSSNLSQARREVDEQYRQVPEAWIEGASDFEYPPKKFDPWGQHKERREVNDLPPEPAAPSRRVITR